MSWISFRDSHPKRDSSFAITWDGAWFKANRGGGNHVTICWPIREVSITLEELSDLGQHWHGIEKLPN